MINKALIIAAGHGSRLRKNDQDTPKPLQKVGGLPLIQRIILTAKKAGIEEFHIVVGYRKEEIIEFCQKHDFGVKINFIDNPDWKKSNGYSVLKAKDHIKENFVLLMSDHVFEPKTLEKFKNSDLKDNSALLAVDYKINEIFDMDDATKVYEDGEKILKIGKEIPEYNCIDTGMFILTPKFLDILSHIKNEKEDFSLSDGIQILAEKKQMGTWDIHDGFWQDVDTPEALSYAENKLFEACRKETDGIISKHFNRHISLGISKTIINTPISANFMTLITSIVGILSGVFMAQGEYFWMVMGAIFFKLSSILDGCDGEISKLKLTQSQTGAWLDTLSDNFTYVIFLVGICIALFKQGHPHIVFMSGLAGFGLLMSLGIMFFYLVKNKKDGTLLAIQEEFHAESKKSFIKNILSKLQFMTKRDFFSVVFLILTILGRIDIILWGYLISTNIVWMALLTHQGESKTS